MEKSTMFPSPFGVRVLKFDAIKAMGITPLFPSPFGVRVLKLWKRRVFVGSMECSFPSPFGVRVLKCLKRKDE